MPLDEFQQATLQECMQPQGCPICRATWKMDAARFGWYVNDGVLDEDTQRNVVRALGFCTPHALYVSLIEGDAFLWSHLGSCMVYVDVIERALLPNLKRFHTRSSRWFLPPFKHGAFSPLHHLFHHDLCPLCFDHCQHETTYREQFMKAFCTREDFRQAYFQADSLCFLHFQQVWPALADEKLVRMLEESQFHALQQCGQATASVLQGQLRQRLCLLYGAETVLWSDFLLRSALNPSQVGPPPCLACQEEEYGTTQMSATLLERLEEVAQFQEQMQPDELIAWFEAIRWFGGSDSAQFLLTSAPTTETSRE